MSGIGEKGAVYISLLSDALISLTTVFTYIWARGSVNWVLTPYSMIGVSLSAPVAAFMIKRVVGGTVKVLIGVSMSLLDLAAILKTALW